MKFNIIDSQAIYRRMLAEPDTAAREEIFQAELLAPYKALIDIFGGDELALVRQWGIYTPEAFDNDDRENVISILDTLSQHNVWGEQGQALQDGRLAFAPYASRIPLETTCFSLMLADSKKAMPLDRGYSGFGGIPGYIIMMFSEPNEYNLYRSKGAVAHELHHNIRFSILPFNPITATVGDYIVAEGLAESFAAELYGQDVVGYYVTDFNEAELAIAKHVIGDALNVTGFNKVRSYIFGDAIAEQMGLPKAGVPSFAGYAIGYRVVQQYLRRTGKSVPEATFVPASQIIAESAFLRS